MNALLAVFTCLLLLFQHCPNWFPPFTYEAPRADCIELPAAGSFLLGTGALGTKGGGAGSGRAVLGSLYSVNIAFSKSLLSVYSAPLPCIYLFPSLTVRYCAFHHPLLFIMKIKMGLESGTLLCFT